MTGYKEFAGLDLDQKDALSDPQFGDMLERMKLSTYQYARSQIKWIRKQLLPAVKEARSLGGDVQVYVVRGGEDGYASSIQLLQRKWNLRNELTNRIPRRRRDGTCRDTS
jgi:tRNA dimethylallyltransferase